MNRRLRRTAPSALDALVILAVGIILFCILAWAIPRGDSSNFCEVRYTLRVYGVSAVLFGEGQEELIPIGCTVRNENGTVALGRVESIRMLPQKSVAVKDGTLSFFESPSEVVLEVTVRGEGVLRNGDGIRIEDVRIAAGSTGTFRLGRYYAERASVIWVEASEEGST